VICWLVGHTGCMPRIAYIVANTDNCDAVTWWFNLVAFDAFHDLVKL
jgi:hypothetical protein